VAAKTDRYYFKEMGLVDADEFSKPGQYISDETIDRLELVDCFQAEDQGSADDSETTSFNGRIDVYSTNEIEGWVACEHADHFPIITLWQGEALIAQTIADLPRPDLDAHFIHGQGFILPVNDYLSGLSTNCEIYIDGAFWTDVDESQLEQEIEAPVLALQDGAIHGIVRRRWEGAPWPTITASARQVGVFVAVELLASSDALQLQFKVRAYAPKLPSAEVDLAIAGRSIAQGLEIAVTTSKIMPAGFPVGQIDTFGPQFITGWMIGTVPDDGRFDVMIDDQPAGSGQANRPREDVETQFGSANTAFAWPIPKRFKDGNDHSLSICRRSDGKELKGSGELRNLSGSNGICFKAEDAGLIVEVRVAKALSRSYLQLTIDGEPTAVYPVVLVPGDNGYLGSVCLPWDDLLGGINRLLAVNIVEYSLSAEIDNSFMMARLGDLRGSVDHLTRGQLIGWAGYTAASQLSVPIQILVDGEIIAECIAGTFRADLESVGFLHFNHGFKITVPGRFMTGQMREATIRCAITGQLLATSLRTVYPKSARSSRLGAGGGTDLDRISRRTADNVPKDAAPEAKLATIVILTRDGQQVLRKCFQSLHLFLPVGVANVVVVDHASSDNTSSLIEEYRGSFDIEHVKMLGNGSFSRSNNEIAFDIETPYVVFLNNDVMLLSDAVTALIDTLKADPNIGAVGCKLIEAREGFDAARASVHHAGIALHPDSDGFIKAREIHDELAIAEANRPIDVYGVTGALLAMRADEFREIGGFPQHYFYGGEDVELSVLVHTRLGKRVVCRNDVVALHYRGYARLTHRGAAILPRVYENERLLNKRIGYYNRKRYQASILCGGNNDSLYRGVIGFICLDAGPFCRSGEYFTALELANEYSALSGCDTTFITPDDDWYDLEGIDCLVVMLHEYDLGQIRNKAPHLTIIVWARNHFDLWLADERLSSVDLVLASSRSFCDALMEQRNIPAKLFKIATNPAWAASGIAVEKFRADAVFNGSNAGAQRAFGAGYDPQLFDGQVKVIGAGWENTPAVAQAWVGAADYASMPDVYASATIVIDDANPSARAWGGTNSRVFDALAAGCLVVSNSDASSEADFAGKLPTWRTMAELAHKVNYFVANPAERDRLAVELRAIVLANHTYLQRAGQFRKYLRGLTGAMRIAIKIGAPNLDDIEQWGDWHFARALARELRALGYCVWIDAINTWYDRTRHADVALVLRGLTAYDPMPDQINIMWLISHPDAVAASELARYDHSFVAAPDMAFAHRNSARCSSLLQFSEFARPGPDTIVDPKVAALLKQIGPEDIVFVGNTRNVRRQFILDVHQRHGIKFIGRGWDLYVSPDDILAEYVDNAALPLIYATAGCVINDHWADMREAGILSNRLFDVAAAGGFFLSDYCETGVELFGREQFCHDVDDFSEQWLCAQADGSHRQFLVDRATTASQQHRAFDRAATIDGTIRRIHGQIMAEGIREW
jgi:GT2 family glycosyltransferase